MVNGVHHPTFETLQRGCRTSEIVWNDSERSVPLLTRLDAGLALTSRLGTHPSPALAPAVRDPRPPGGLSISVNGRLEFQKKKKSKARSCERRTHGEYSVFASSLLCARSFTQSRLCFDTVAWPPALSFHHSLRLSPQPSRSTMSSFCCRYMDVSIRQQP